MIGALEAWLNVHGWIPDVEAWDTAGQSPCAETVRTVLRTTWWETWGQLLDCSAEQARQRWLGERQLRALTLWYDRERRWPRRPEWDRADQFPRGETISQRWGSWATALAAAQEWRDERTVHPDDPVVGRNWRRAQSSRAKGPLNESPGCSICGSR